MNAKNNFEINPINPLDCRIACEIIIHNCINCQIEKVECMRGKKFEKREIYRQIKID
jgi:hypothetical protein